MVKELVDKKMNNKKMKLHLGCGMRYLEGYTNVDYPVSNQTVQINLKADEYRDISTLVYPGCSVEEIRLHHVFEHFPRPVALALLCRWRDWLRVGGLLRIETPDFRSSIISCLSPFISFYNKQQIVRHIFGSHEASWAAHYDGWYKDKFHYVLKKIGFDNIKFVKNRYGYLRNIEVFAYKNECEFDAARYRKIVKQILTWSLVRDGYRKNIEKSESDMLDVWMKAWESAYKRIEINYEFKR